ncbi:MAG: RloB domain-containing protein [Pseudomonadota bacterium]
MAKRVLEEAKRLIAKHGDGYLGYIILFDKDTYFPQDSNLKNSLQSKNNVEIYMSEPCIEHWLLAHFQSINLSQENKCKFYEKQLKKYINQENVEHAINCYPDIGEIPKAYFVNG